MPTIARCSEPTLLTRLWQAADHGGLFHRRHPARQPEPASWRGLGPLPTHTDGLTQAEITTAIVESAHSGKVISLPSQADQQSLLGVRLWVHNTVVKR